MNRGEIRTGFPGACDGHSILPDELPVEKNLVTVVNFPQEELKTVFHVTGILNGRGDGDFDAVPGVPVQFFITLPFPGLTGNDGRPG